MRSGEVTTSVRIWRSPRVKVGNAYRIEGGRVVVDAIREIALDDITPKMARESGFAGVVDLLKTARHGSGERVYFVTFHFEGAPEPVSSRSDHREKQTTPRRSR